MAFGDVGAAAIMFISVVLMTVLLAGIFTSQVTEATYSSVEKQKHLSNQIKTDITIQHVYHEAGVVYAYVKNVGSTPLRAEEFTIYINNEFYTANGTNSSITLVSETNTQNVNILDPDEVVLIETNNSLADNAYHEYLVLTAYNTKHSKTFTT